MNMTILIEGGIKNMDDEVRVPPEKLEGQHPVVCDPEQVEKALHIIEIGTKHAFLDDELGVEETKTILDRIQQAREACESGNQNACSALNDLMNELTRDSKLSL